jgi:nitrate/TMAO reductase-like tetraheme cytochrome c subunit
MTDASPRHSGHPVSATGIVLATISALLFALLWILEAAGWISNPYVGLLAFVAIPAFFVLGLLLIPLGVWLARRRARRGLAAVPLWPSVDLNDARTRRTALFVLLATVVNLAIVMMAGYEAVHYMDSPAFCGAVCHAPMAPQFVQWQQAPHASVACATCHVGSERGAFLKAKIAGTRRLAHMISGRYPRPIRAGDQAVPAAAFTCEQCHSTAAFSGDVTRVVRTYADDEANTESQTALRLHIGMTSAPGNDAGAIHWHAQSGRLIEYVVTDAQEDTIPWVRVTGADGRTRTFVTDGSAAKTPTGTSLRRMDCLSCHSRPAHPFAASAERAVDAALTDGRLDRSLPYIRREAVRVLNVSHPTQDAAAADIDGALTSFYRATYPALAASQAEAVARAVRATQVLSRQSVFPSMGITWGTYVSRLGHTDTPGCFRCHDDGHKADDGRVIRQDCTLCHAMPE